MTHSLLDAYRRARERSRALFELLHEQSYYSRPIELRHPVVFYEGHLPAFALNTLVKRTMGRPGIDAHLETLFARGIDPSGDRADADRGAWPDRQVVRAFAAHADQDVCEAMAAIDEGGGGTPPRHLADAAHTILEHEAMHQETLLYMWHQLPHDQKRRPLGYAPHAEGALRDDDWVEIAAGVATLGVNRDSVPFGWDNEFPLHRVAVQAFVIRRHDVTNAQFLEFVSAGGYNDPRWWVPEDWAWVQRTRRTHPPFWSNDEGAWFWRGMFESIPLPPAWPVYVSHAEATAFARWRAARLPTEAEFHRAAYGTPNDGERQHPWGSEEPAPEHGVFDFTSWDPEPVGSHPAGRSAWGVHDLVGNGWEWTSTLFTPFPGFAPMPSYPEYSADFFDGAHFVLKGASPATTRVLLRPSFRNWYRPRYPYVYATFRLARDTE